MLHKIRLNLLLYLCMYVLVKKGNFLRNETIGRVLTASSYIISPIINLFIQVAWTSRPSNGSPSSSSTGTVNGRIVTLDRPIPTLFILTSILEILVALWSLRLLTGRHCWLLNNGCSFIIYFSVIHLSSYPSRCPKFARTPLQDRSWL